MQQYVVGNWKMYLNHANAKKLSKGCADKMVDANRPLPRVVLCPSHPHLISVADMIKGTSVELGAQDCHPEQEGPHTGEVSVTQVKDLEAKHVLVGHSERRREQKETQDLIHKKVKAVINHGMRAILCVGETAIDREQGNAMERVAAQLRNELPESFTPDQLMIAYEPIWAIGTKVTPSPKQIDEMQAMIREELNKLQPNGNLVPVLYGGSVSGQNSADILACDHCNGVLVGVASIDLREFWTIVESSKS